MRFYCAEIKSNAILYSPFLNSLFRYRFMFNKFKVLQIYNKNLYIVEKKVFKFNY